MEEVMEGEKNFKIAFFGSGNFAYKFLLNIIEKKINPEIIITAPDAPSGRGRQLKPTKVKEIALEKNIPCFTPYDPNSPGFLEELKKYEIDYLILADYGKILKRELLLLPKIKPLNLHPSLLPKYRGAAPLERAIMNGEKYTGFTIFIMNEKIDAGDIVYQEKIEIDDKTKGELEDEISLRSSEVLYDILLQISENKIKPKPQKGEVIYASKIKEEELWIDWKKDAEEVKNKIHALSPIPGARTHFDGKYTKIYKVRVHKDMDGPPGKIKIEEGRLYVFCAKGAIEIIEIQPAGKKIMEAKEYILGYHPIWAE
uniref:Methionyl-tRNA formyltransferase n=1 Tax=candidate division WOR-3 bacterium TaxID=2052148 RepID=A0A7V4ABC5_UNCW3